MFKLSCLKSLKMTLRYPNQVIVFYKFSFQSSFATSSPFHLHFLSASFFLLYPNHRSIFLINFHFFMWLKRLYLYGLKIRESQLNKLYRNLSNSYVVLLCIHWAKLNIPKLYRFNHMLLHLLWFYTCKGNSNKLYYNVM